MAKITRAIARKNTVNAAAPGPIDIVAITYSVVTSMVVGAIAAQPRPQASEEPQEQHDPEAVEQHLDLERVLVLAHELRVVGGVEHVGQVGRVVAEEDDERDAEQDRGDDPACRPETLPVLGCHAGVLRPRASRVNPGVPKMGVRARE